MGSPLERYLDTMRGRLSVSDEEKDAIVEEVRAHLQEHTESLRARGMDDEAAQQSAVRSFGAPGRIAHRFESSHLVVWTRRRFGVGVLKGAAYTWGIWLLVTFPFAAQLFTSQGAQFLPAMDFPQPWWALPALALSASTPLSPAFGSLHVIFYGLLTQAQVPHSILELLSRFDVFLSFGVFTPLWFVPFLVAFSIAPFRWGGRTRQWRRAGLAYGVGAWLSTVVPLLLIFIAASALYGQLHSDGAFTSIYTIVGVLLRMLTQLLLLPIALLASDLGHRIRFNSRGRAVIAG